MSETRTKGLVVGALMLGAGLAYLYLTASLPRRAAVDASTIPYVLAFAMVALGALQCLAAWRKPRAMTTAAMPAATAPADEDALPGGKPNYATVLQTLILVAGFTASLRLLGFPLAAAIYLFLQFIVLTPGGRKPALGAYAVIAVLTAAIVFAAFRYGFDLLLPAGPLTPYLP